MSENYVPCPRCGRENFRCSGNEWRCSACGYAIDEDGFRLPRDYDPFNEE